MRREVFTAAIEELQQRTPFRPFTVITVSGRRQEVDHPRAIVVRDGTAVYAAPGGIPVIFDHESVDQVIGDLTDHPAAQ